MAKSVRITLPVNQPKESLELSDAIIKKDTAEGMSSSLAGVVDVADFTAKVSLAKSKRATAADKEVEAQSKYGHIKTNSGLAENQNEDTKEVILWYVRQVRDILSVIYSGTEEDLGPFGFNVVITTSGGRKHVRIDIPEQPKEAVELAEAIVAHHTFLAGASPLTAPLIDMVAFGTLTSDTRTLLDDWTDLRGETQSLNNEALTIIGYGAGQKITSEGTIYNYFGKIRKRLLQKFKGTEEDLSLWGFKVVISKGRKKKASSISLKGKVTDKSTGSALANALVYAEEIDTFTLSDEEGNFEFEKLDDGTYTIVAHKTGYGDATKEDVVVAAGTVTTVNIELEALPPAGSISGTVTKAGVGVSATISVVGITGGTLTDPSGNFSKDDIPAGAQTIRATLSAIPATLDQPVTIIEGGNVVVNFAFP
jgi:hypothetical protein